MRFIKLTRPPGNRAIIINSAWITTMCSLEQSTFTELVVAYGFGPITVTESVADILALIDAQD